MSKIKNSYPTLDDELANPSHQNHTRPLASEAIIWVGGVCWTEFITFSKCGCPGSLSNTHEEGGWRRTVTTDVYCNSPDIHANLTGPSFETSNQTMYDLITALRQYSPHIFCFTQNYVTLAKLIRGSGA